MSTLARDRAEVLNRLPMVRWDRCVRFGDGCVQVFGWIDRQDGRSDFVLVAFLWPEEPMEHTFWTSSAEYSAQISDLLYGESDEHVNCERVDDVFGGLVTNRVRPT